MAKTNKQKTNILKILGIILLAISLSSLLFMFIFEQVYPYGEKEVDCNEIYNFEIKGDNIKCYDERGSVGMRELFLSLICLSGALFFVLGGIVLTDNYYKRKNEKFVEDY